MKRVLLFSSAVGALGDGPTGGVTDMALNTAHELCRRGYEVDILASENSVYNGPATLIGIQGEYQPTIATKGGDATYPIVASSLLAGYCDYARAHQKEYGLILNFCNDWLPYYLTPFFDTPLLHQANLCDENAVVTQQIQKTVADYPHHVSVMSHAQAGALGIAGKVAITGFGVDVSQYSFSATPQKDVLLWCARVTPQKGLMDAAEIARSSGKRLHVCGFMEDRAYFDSVVGIYGTTVEYRGFLNKADLIREMGRAEALLCTHTWVEAFGIVVVEALACGTPVLTYDRGGPSEIVTHGKSGFIIPTRSIEKAVEAVAALPGLKRDGCRSLCEKEYSLQAYGDRLEAWLTKR